MAPPLGTNADTAALAWGGRRFWTGVWRVVDPKITLASVASLFLGTAAAARAGGLDLRWLVLTVLGIFFLESAKNMSGELFDWDSGVDARVTPEDRSPFSGGKRVLVDRLMTRKQTVVVAFTLYALGGIVGLLIALHEPRVLWLGLAGAAIAFFYHAPPFKLSYRGLGEIAVMLAYGPMILCGAYLVQRGEIAPWLLHLGMPLGVAIAAFLFVNELPDARADAASGKRTLVVRLGKRRASRAFALFPIVTFGYLLALPAIAPVGPGIWLGFVGLPFAIAAVHRVWTRHERTADIVPAQGWTLLSFVLFALGAGGGILLFR
jgi:1,4-dihydroxy-2-naphthoate polyprenyltransferase